MATMVHSLHALAGKTSSTRETVELQLAGCVLVEVVSHVGWLDSRGKNEILNIEILTELMNVLKLPTTYSEFVQQWRTDFHRHAAMDRYAIYVIIIRHLHCICSMLHINNTLAFLHFRSIMVLSNLQLFWAHMANKDRMHFDILPLLLELCEEQSADDVFQVIGCEQSTFSSLFPVTKIKE